MTLVSHLLMTNMWAACTSFASLFMARGGQCLHNIYVKQPHYDAHRKKKHNYHNNTNGPSFAAKSKARLSGKTQQHKAMALASHTEFSVSLHCLVY